MAYVLTYADHEDKASRKQWEVEIGTRLTRFYDLPVPAATDLKPARGTLLPDETGLLGARVMSAILLDSPSPTEGCTRMRVELIRPVAYDDTSITDFQELRGSRKETTSEKMRTMVRWGVSENLQDLPFEGEGLAAANTLLDLRCSKVDKGDKDTVPGLYFIRLSYIAYEPYLKRMLLSGTLNPAAGGTYTESGVYAGHPAYTDGTYWIWYATGTDPYWCISTTKGTATNSWRAPGLISDAYNPSGTYAGTATLALSRATGHFIEIKGSRILRTLRGQRVATRLAITDDGTGAWAEGDAYPSASGLTGLYCIHVDSDIPSGIPGITLVEAHYHAFQAYAIS